MSCEFICNQRSEVGGPAGEPGADVLRKTVECLERLKALVDPAPVYARVLVNKDVSKPGD